MKRRMKRKEVQEKVERGRSGLEMRGYNTANMRYHFLMFMRSFQRAILHKSTQLVDYQNKYPNKHDKCMLDRFIELEYKNRMRIDNNLIFSFVF